VFGEPGQRLPDSMVSILASLADVIALAVGHASVYEDLKRLSDTKTRFMFQASHELRSPLDSIRSMAHTILEGFLGDLTDDQRQMLSRIDFRAAMASEIVGDLLVLAKGRAELTTLEPERIDLDDIVRQVCELSVDRAREKGILLAGPGQPSGLFVMGNPESLRSAIGNLTTNAVKYTEQGGRVTVDLRREGEQAILKVSDTGIGIPKDEAEKLFTEFFRASNAQTVEEVGTGLGLSIVKAAVEQHGGSVEVESELGVGTTFTIRLPTLA
jgi:signal transduction histidine kinase